MGRREKKNWKFEKGKKQGGDLIETKDNSQSPSRRWASGRNRDTSAAETRRTCSYGTDTIGLEGYVIGREDSFPLTTSIFSKTAKARSLSGMKSRRGARDFKWESGAWNCLLQSGKVHLLGRPSLADDKSLDVSDCITQYKVGCAVHSSYLFSVEWVFAE